ncbi:MAG: gliding motility-associated C-terminal domain-containing protein [Bacteroidales bacterium]|jgi:gliding motility-associated-like protein|nr:gliding motility-associated C-terminal domain-containing protein [Bacteroidales bacterium]
MKRLYVLTGLILSMLGFMPIGLQAQCPNLNFSMANFTYWQAYLGSCSGGIRIDLSSPTAGRHTIIDAQQIMMTGQMQDERCMAIPKVPTGFNYSAKLGNEITGAEMEALEYTMTIDSTNSLLILHFAWAMEDPNHDASEQPQFTMTIKDSSGRAIPSSILPCGNVNFRASQILTDLVCKTSNFLARNWTTVGFSLESLIGQKIKIYFETRDCTLSGHFGYAYIVGECRPMSIELMYCEGQSAARMRAPDGFVWYKWTRSSQPSWIIEGSGHQFQNIVVSDPIDKEEFICAVTSALKGECSATLRTVIEKTSIDADFAYGIMEDGEVPIVLHNFENWYDTCNRTATFVDLSTVKNSKKESILWEILGLDVDVFSFDSLFTFTFPDPEKNEPVEYVVRLTVIAENGCIDTSQGRTNHRIMIYPSPRIKIEGENQLCAGDSAYLTAVALRSKFIDHTWKWEDSNKVIQTAKGDSLVIYGPGTYCLTSKDSAGCFAQDTFVVTPLKPQMKVTIKDVDCYGDATGKFTHERVLGGQSPYQSFYWILLDSNGNSYREEGNVNGAIYIDLIAGTYYFEAIDARGCVLRDAIVIKQNDSLKIKGTQTPTTCGLDNGSLKLTAIGGIPPYKFEIRKEDSTLVTSLNNASNLSAGVYRITVIDNVGCVTSDNITVTATPIPYIELNSKSLESCESKNGFIWVTPKDVVFPVKFTWSTGREEDTTNIVSSLKAGTYTVTTVDANGCQAKMDIEVDAYPNPIINVTKTPETCQREDGTISLTVDSDRPETLEYVWEGRNETSPVLTGLKAGTYKVTVSDEICTVEDTIEINHVDGPVANFEANSYNVPNNTIFTLTDISQGTVKISNWTMGDGNTQTGRIVHYSYEVSGDYRIVLEVIDENGCTDTISKIIHVYEELNVFIPNMFTPNGDGKNDTWKPQMSEYSKEGYQLSIFDRWGQRIFHTTDTEEAWNGSVDGKRVAPNTVYSYRITVRDFTGQEHEFIGQITVLK